MDQEEATNVPEEEEELHDDSLVALIDLLREEGAQACIKQFIDHKREAAKESYDIQLKQIELQKESVKRGTWFFWIVSFAVIIAVSVLAGLDKIDSQVVGALFGAIVGYLFGRLKKD